MKVSTMNVARVKNEYQSISEWPAVTIVFSVFNEEKVIKRKLESILNSDYPKDKLQILIGSDNSTDLTHQIIEEFITQNKNIALIKKESRHGKLKIINEKVKDIDYFNQESPDVEEEESEELNDQLENDEEQQEDNRMIIDSD